jgi:predicted ester cyclase
VDHEGFARMQFTAMATGDADLAAQCLDPEHVNHMAVGEPPACALPGVPGFIATSAWLRAAFSDLRFEIIEAVGDDGRTIAHVWMRGTQDGPFVVFPPGGKPVAFPPTRRDFAVRQCHILGLRDGRHITHSAVRDDLGMLTQLGHLPPSPAVAARMARWNLSGKARRAVDAAVARSEQAAAGTASVPTR